MNTKNILMVSAACCAILSGCCSNCSQNKQQPTSPAATKAMGNRKEETNMEQQNKKVRLPSGLEYEVIKAAPANAPHPAKGQNVVVNYTGWLTNGQKFDSSIDRGQPFVFRVGMGQVIKGWDEGVMLMKVGDKWRFTIPADLAYGNRAISVIPANSTLIFEVELLGVS